MLIADNTRINLLLRYKTELYDELHAILAYWQTYTVDTAKGGFYGRVDNNNVPAINSPKGIVLNSRILWSFSTACYQTARQEYLPYAKRAFDYILDHFIDPLHGGVYWSVDADGNPLDKRKQIYGLSFCIYGLCAYYEASADERALLLAEQLFRCIEHYSFDDKEGGYIEAFTETWQPIDDLRLSEKDANEKKTMNTHLHLIEAYAALYRVWPDTQLRKKIEGLLDLFFHKIAEKSTGHLGLFFDEKWQSRSSLQSFGHDIEAAWLLPACAIAIRDEDRTAATQRLTVILANTAAGGLDEDGGLWYEYEPTNGQWIREKHAWPQAEAMLGFFNAWELTGEERFLENSLRVWEFVKDHIRDRERGEWRWGVYADYSSMNKEKAGFWKCPYHNTRACLEIIQRIEMHLQ